MTLEFEGARTLDTFATDCRICMQLDLHDKDAYRTRTGVSDYHMPIGTLVIATRDGYYAHADHDLVEVALYDNYLENLPEETKKRKGL